MLPLRGVCPPALRRVAPRGGLRLLRALHWVELRALHRVERLALRQRLMATPRRLVVVGPRVVVTRAELGGAPRQKAGERMARERVAGERIRERVAGVRVAEVLGHVRMAGARVAGARVVRVRVVKVRVGWLRRLLGRSWGSRPFQRVKAASCGIGCPVTARVVAFRGLVRLGGTRSRSGLGRMLGLAVLRTRVARRRLGRLRTWVLLSRWGLPRTRRGSRGLRALRTRWVVPRGGWGLGGPGGGASMCLGLLPLWGGGGWGVRGGDGIPSLTRG
jgi:hypothetical protein